MSGATERHVFKARTRGAMGVIYKDDGSMLIWGPASVEVVDKENDVIRAEALEEALPQLLRRERISVDHSDQLVGRIKNGIELDEEVEVDVGSETIKRDSFPTAVMDPDEDGVPEKGLYVAAEIWDDTRQSRQAQKAIEEGEFDSYSISGETITSTTQVKDGDLIEDIDEIDLSAVTLCESGMNQRAKFGVVSKSLSAFAKDSENNSNMSDNDDSETVNKETLEAFKDAARDVLPDGELATKETIDSALAEHEEQMAEKYGLQAEEKELDSEEAKEAIVELADATGKDADEIANAVREAIEGSDKETIEAGDDMEEEEMPPEDDDVTEVPDDEIEDPDDDDEMEVEVEEEEEKSVVEQLEEKGAPDDLVDAVKQYVDDPAEKEEDEDDDSMPDYDDDDEEEKDDESVSKSDPAAQTIDDLFVSVEGMGPVTGDNVEKSYEFEKDDEGDDEASLAALSELEKSGAIN